VVLGLLPDLLSFTRLLASPFIVWLLIGHQYQIALLLTLVAGLTDWLDGYAARRLGVSGQFGVVLDPLADKIMLVIVFVGLGVLGLIPMWMLVLAIARDLVIVTGALLLRIFRNARKFRPVFIGKVSTFFQIVLVLLTLIYAAYPLGVFDWLTRIALFSSAFFTTWSGATYIRKGILMARRQWSGD